MNGGVLCFSVEAGPYGPLVYVEQLPDLLPFPVNRDESGEWQQEGLAVLVGNPNDGWRAELSFANGLAVYVLDDYGPEATETLGRLISWECSL